MAHAGCNNRGSHMQLRDTINKHRINYKELKTIGRNYYFNRENYILKKNWPDLYS